MAAHSALAETGAEYTLVLVEEDDDGTRPAAYRAINPWGQVPTLEDGDLVLTESAAIVLYLADRFPDSGLGPEVGTAERAELYRWLAYLANAVQTTCMRWFYPERFTTDPDAAGAVRDRAALALRGHLNWIDSELAGRPWLLGDRPRGADHFLFMLTRWARFQDPPAWDRPNIGGHWQRMLERPAVQRMMSEQELS
jgi:glutathione S-transferase